MDARKIPEQFKVAFSFAGEQRDLVRAIAEAVQARLGPDSVFFDEWYEHYIAGSDADLKLQKIYGERCTLAVVCVSERYGGKPWTQAEHAAIRARQMQESATKIDAEQLGILPIRVGDGNVEGILFNAIVPDAREKTLEQSAELILKRLALILPEVPIPPMEQPSWPTAPIPYEHGLADRTEQWPEIQQLMTAGAAKRLLLFKGNSGHSKSALLNAAAAYAQSLGVAVGYVDFKDSQLLHQANLLRQLRLDLGQVLPGFATGEPDAWKLLESLRQLKAPVLLLLDTYEKAADSKDLAEWIENALLAEAARSPWLRCLIAGQKIPDSRAARWREQAAELALEPIDDQQAWKDWIRRKNPQVSDQHVESVVLGLQGAPSAISTVLSTFAQQLPGTA